MLGSSCVREREREIYGNGKEKQLFGCGLFSNAPASHRNNGSPGRFWAALPARQPHDLPNQKEKNAARVRLSVNSCVQQPDRVNIKACRWMSVCVRPCVYASVSTFGCAWAGGMSESEREVESAAAVPPRCCAQCRPVLALISANSVASPVASAP